MSKGRRKSLRSRPKEIAKLVPEATAISAACTARLFAFTDEERHAASALTQSHIAALSTADDRLREQLAEAEKKKATLYEPDLELERHIRELRSARLHARAAAVRLSIGTLPTDEAGGIMYSLAKELTSAALGVGHERNVLRAPEPCSGGETLEHFRLRAAVVAAIQMNLDASIVFTFAEDEGLSRASASELVKNQKRTDRDGKLKSGTAAAFQAACAEAKREISDYLEAGADLRTALSLAC